MNAAMAERSRVAAVSEKRTARTVQQRREALGMTAKALAERAGVDRSRIAAIEEGKPVRATTLGAVESALSALEREMSGPYDEMAGQVTFRVHGNFGVEVTVQGPVENLSELRQEVSALIASMEKAHEAPGK